jgi:hypothetical protein
VVWEGEDVAGDVEVACVSGNVEISDIGGPTQTRANTVVSGQMNPDLDSLQPIICRVLPKLTI